MKILETEIDDFHAHIAWLARQQKPGEWREVRCLLPRGHRIPAARVGLFDCATNPEILRVECLTELSAWGVAWDLANWYFSANTTSQLPDRQQITNARATRLCIWPLDFDPIRLDDDRETLRDPAGHKLACPSSDSEQSSAWETMGDVRAWLEESYGFDFHRHCGFVDSGNGWQMHVVIDLPVCDAWKIKLITRFVAKKFSSEEVEIDIAVANPGRILRLGGTWNRKGPSTAERPHRMTQFITFADEPEAFDIAQLVADAQRDSPEDGEPKIAVPRPLQKVTGRKLTAPTLPDAVKTRPQPPSRSSAWDELRRALPMPEYLARHLGTQVVNGRCACPWHRGDNPTMVQVGEEFAFCHKPGCVCHEHGGWSIVGAIMHDNNFSTATEVMRWAVANGYAQADPKMKLSASFVQHVEEDNA